MDQVGKLGSWADLYVMLGSSAAALLGLLFVATSLHLREIVNDAIYKIRAQDTMLVLVAMLVQAAAILTPQPITFVGIELFIINLWGLWFPVHLLLQAARIRSRKRGSHSFYRMVFLVTAHAIGLAGAAALIAGGQWGLYPVTASYVGGLIGTVWNAWNIMLGIGQTENKRGR